MQRYLPLGGLALAALFGGLAAWFATRPAPSASRPATHQTATRGDPIPADPAGISSALRDRAGQIAPCWKTWRAAHPEGPADPVLAIALTADGLADARLSTGDGGAFDVCVQRALADATFAPPEVGLLTLLVPVPME